MQSFDALLKSKLLHAGLRRLTEGAWPPPTGLRRQGQDWSAQSCCLQAANAPSLLELHLPRNAQQAGARAEIIARPFALLLSYLISTPPVMSSHPDFPRCKQVRTKKMGEKHENQQILLK